MFDLNRRKLLIGSLITGAALSAPSLVFAEDRYQVLIELQRDVIHAKNAYNETKEQMFGTKLPNNAERAIIGEVSGFDAKMDKLLGFLMAEFRRSDLEDARVQQGVRDLMRGNVKIDTLNASELRLIEDAVVSIAVVKSLLSYYRVPVDVNSKNFDTFATHYRRIIF